MISRANWSNLQNLDGESLVGNVNRVLPPLLSLLLVVLIGWQLAGVAWKLVPGTAAGDVVQTPAGVTTGGSSANNSTDVAAIAASHLFGVADASSEEPIEILPADEDLADTRLTNLILKGTVAAPDPRESVALIADSGAEQKVFGIGDSVSGSTTLHAVYASRVVLNENGALTNLRLPRDFEAVAEPASARRVTRTNRQAATSGENIQAVVTQNLPQLMDIIRPTQFRENGQPAGFRVYPGRNRQQFSDLGLKPGDLITDIDGQSLTDPTTAMKIFQSLESAQQVTVTVKRNGQPETLVLDMNQLNLGGQQKQ